MRGVGRGDEEGSNAQMYIGWASTGTHGWAGGESAFKMPCDLTLRRSGCERRSSRDADALVENLEELLD